MAAQRRWIPAMVRNEAPHGAGVGAPHTAMVEPLLRQLVDMDGPQWTVQLVEQAGSLVIVGVRGWPDRTLEILVINCDGKAEAVRLEESRTAVAVLRDPHPDIVLSLWAALPAPGTPGAPKTPVRDAKVRLCGASRSATDAARHSG